MSVTEQLLFGGLALLLTLAKVACAVAVIAVLAPAAVVCWMTEAGR